MGVGKRGTRYRQHYRELIRRHFIHAEASLFAVVRTLKYDEFRRMTASRQLLWNAFIRTHRDLERGTRRFNTEWTQFVLDWYVNQKLDTYNVHMKRAISPWSWFDKVSYSLPEEMRYTKASRRTTRRDDKETPSVRAHKQRWIHQLKATLDKHPDRARELVPRIINLGGKVSTQWKRKAGVA